MEADHRAIASTKIAPSRLGVRACRAQWAIDRRTKIGKRLERAMVELAHLHQIEADIANPLLRRAAELSIIAEDGRRALIRRKPGANVADVVKAENLSARAARDLANVASGRPNATPSLAAYLAEIASNCDATSLPLDESGKAAGEICEAAATPASTEADAPAGEPMAPLDEHAQ